MATSREPIGIDGEVAWRVPSLALPNPSDLDVAELELNPAVRLFVDRAMAAQPRFALTARNAAAVTQICRRLEGIPLALELAAARVGALAPEQVAARLDQRFRLLTGGSRAALPRQQTLGATLDWSYGLLHKPERRLFERLAVFAGGWTLEAAEAVCGGDGLSQDDVLDLLVRLVRKSLVVAEEDAYRLLESVHDYAREKLVGRPRAETAAIRERHAEFYSNMVLRQDQDRRGVAPLVACIASAPPAALDHLDDEHDNLRAALGWRLETARQAEGLGLAVALSQFWFHRGRYTEARHWLEAMLDLADRAAQSPGSDSAFEASPLNREVAAALRAEALSWAGWMANRQGDYAQARVFCAASVALWRGLGKSLELLLPLALLGGSLWLAGDAEQATVVLNECLSLSRAVGARETIVISLRNLGFIARSKAQYDRAAALFVESLTEAESLGWVHAYQLARSKSNLGRVAYLQGELSQAQVLLQDAIGVIREARIAGHELADCLDWMPALAGAQRRPVRAARLFGAAEARWRASGGVRHGPERPAYERDLAGVQAMLDRHAFDVLWAEGLAMGAEQEIECALNEANQEQPELAPQLPGVNPPR